MDKRQHIALTEAQIIAAEKGELQLEYRNGEKVCQVIWIKPPYDQDRACLNTIKNNGVIIKHKLNGEGEYNSYCDLFISEPAEQKPLYEVGEIIEQDTPSGWLDVEFIENRGGQVCVWSNGMYKSIPHTNLRKKQKQKTVTLEGKVMTVKEAIEYLTNL